MLTKITKYKKENDNKYTIYLDNDTKLKLYDDIIIKYNLLIEKNIDDKKIQIIKKDNDNLASYYKAIKYITKKMRTEQEVRIYLEKSYPKEMTEKTINKIKEEGLFNNDLYLKSYINDSIYLTNKGPNKIKNELKQLGFTSNEIDSYLDNIDYSIWHDKLNKIVNKKINSNHQYSINKLKLKLAYDLSNQGFSKSMIDEILNKIEFQKDEKIIQKEYTKIYNKLSKKYSEKELDYQIRNKLFQKGFSLDEINALKKDD